MYKFSSIQPTPPVKSDSKSKEEPRPSKTFTFHTNPFRCDPVEFFHKRALPDEKPAPIGVDFEEKEKEKEVPAYYQKKKTKKRERKKLPELIQSDKFTKHKKSRRKHVGSSHH